MRYDNSKKPKQLKIKNSNCKDVNFYKKSFPKNENDFYI